MTSSQHQHWIDLGSPNHGLVLPLKNLKSLLVADGWVVYDIGNTSHLDHRPPEDHTPYSETNWPGEQEYGWLHAIDIMPDGKSAQALTNLGLNIFNARQSGQITFVKYMNWPSDGSLSRAVQDKWEPNHSRGNSSDAGHIHLSSVTGVINDDVKFDPRTGVVVANAPVPSTGLRVDGKLGPDTIRTWQRIMGTSQDGVITQPPGRSDLVKAVQRRLNAHGAGLSVDGQGIRQGGPWSHTTLALQRYLGTHQDGVISSPVSDVIKAVQSRLNLGWF
jgi:hypothetical protein